MKRTPNRTTELNCLPKKKTGQLYTSKIIRAPNAWTGCV